MCESRRNLSSHWEDGAEEAKLDVAGFICLWRSSKRDETSEIPEGVSKAAGVSLKKGGRSPPLPPIIEL
jgi:hypothetical protein